MRANAYTSNAAAEVISDTGTSFIGGPQSNTDGIARQFNSNYDSSQGLYPVPCNTGTAPDVVFTINGNPYTIQKKNFIVQVSQIYLF